MQVVRQGDGIGEDTVAVASDDDALHQRVGSVVEQFDIYVARAADGGMRDGIHQMGAEPHGVARHIVGTVGVDVDDLLGYVGIIVQYALLDVQRVGLAEQ